MMPKSGLGRFVRRFSSFSENLGKCCRLRPTLPATAIDWSAAYKRVRLQARSIAHASGTRSCGGTSNHRVSLGVCRSVSGLEWQDSRPSDIVRECHMTLSTLSLVLVIVVRSHLSSEMVHQRAKSPAGPHLPTDVPRIKASGRHLCCSVGHKTRSDVKIRCNIDSTHYLPLSHVLHHTDTLSCNRTS